MAKTKYKLNGDTEVVIKKTLPKGYKLSKGMTEPAGTCWAQPKGESLFKRDKNGKVIGKNPKFKQMLVITDEELFTTRLAENRVYEPKRAADFTLTEAMEKKVKSKEVKLRKEIQKRKEEDARAVAAAKARREAEKLKAKPKETGKKPYAYGRKEDSLTGYYGPETEKKDKPKKAPTYTVAGKTFATMKEAKAYKAALKSKTCEIKEGKKKPTHKIVSFTAKSK